MNKLDVIEKKILPIDRLLTLVNGWRLLEQKIVFTNGCFDLIHLGHIDYLSKAADFGSKLIIGLNSDSSTSRLKGPGRPIMDETSRAHILASIFFVDAVVLFPEDTPIELIKAIKPHVLVKGADYSVDNIVGADIVLSNGGQVKTVEFLDGYSTTSIERRIINSQIKNF